MKTSKWRGVFKMTDHGTEYWIAQLIVDKKVTRRRTSDEDSAARKYDILRIQNGMKPCNFPNEEYSHVRRQTISLK